MHYLNFVKMQKNKNFLYSQAKTPKRTRMKKRNKNESRNTSICSTGKQVDGSGCFRNNVPSSATPPPNIDDVKTFFRKENTKTLFVLAAFAAQLFGFQYFVIATMRDNNLFLKDLVWSSTTSPETFNLTGKAVQSMKNLYNLSLEHQTEQAACITGYTQNTANQSTAGQHIQSQNKLNQSNTLIITDVFRAHTIGEEGSVPFTRQVVKHCAENKGIGILHTHPLGVYQCGASEQDIFTFAWMHAHANMDYFGVLCEAGLVLYYAVDEWSIKQLMPQHYYGVVEYDDVDKNIDDDFHDEINEEE